MLALLKFIPGLLLLGRTFASIWTNYQARKAARKEIAGEIAQAEVRAAHAVAEIMAQPRDPADTVKRLRDGKF